MKSIERNWNEMPTIVDMKFEDGQIIENTLAGIGSIIVDHDFINEMALIVNKVKDEKNLLRLIPLINNKISNYFYSKEVNNSSRGETYMKNVVVEDGLILGTKISSLKGKNVALCSEKSIAAYVILEKLYSMHSITRKPLFVLSQLSIDDSNDGPHAFIILNKELCNDPTKHIIFDPENSTLVEKDGVTQKYAGLYSLTDDEYNDFLNGSCCTPISLYDYLDGYHDVGKKRTYGKIEKEKKR